MPSFEDNHDENVNNILPIHDDSIEGEYIHAISKLRCGKSLSDPYEPILEKKVPRKE